MKLKDLDFDSTLPDWNSSSENEESDNELGREHYQPVGESKLKKSLELEMDPKYEGTKVSRKELNYQSSEGEDFVESDGQEMDFEEFEGIDESGGDQEESAEEEGDHQEQANEWLSKLVNQEKEEERMVKNMSKQATEDLEKGEHVRAQLSLWDGALDLRIRTQKIVDVANSIPQGKDYAKFIDESGVQESIKLATDEILSLFDSIVELQKELVLPEQLNCEISTLKRKRGDSLEEILQACWDDVLEPLDTGYKAFRDETIEKWNNKIQMSSGAINQKKFKVINQSVISQISTALANPEKLIKRTRLNRSGKKADVNSGKLEALSITSDHEDNQDKKELTGEDEYESDIFDDGDYYQQLLKELIESRMNDTNDPVLLGLKYAQLKQMNQKKKKATVDTKASKGRKIRYQVQEKIQNFMAPEPRGNWHDEMKQELFASLLGRREEKKEDIIVEDGFKLF